MTIVTYNIKILTIRRLRGFWDIFNPNTVILEEMQLFTCVLKNKIKQIKSEGDES